MRKDLLLIAIIVATLTLMVVPLGQGTIDLLLALNMSLAVLLLMVALYLRHPSDFPTFPSVILIGTAFRLALSVGTTRLILSEADAGQIIETFGEFVVSGSVVIGLVIFAIITVVQFLVVTKGAERVAEVGARFALDALPGKQLSIDAELRAGDLTAEEATRRRRQLDRDSQFFGAMDGAMKFIKGDAIAGMIIICINLLGGIAVGMAVHGFAFGEAVAVFSLLTVGDGLVAQIPALLMSLCAGVIVTRVVDTENEDLGSDIFSDLIADPRVPAIAAVIVLAMGLIPGFPILIFAGLSAVLLIAALVLRRAGARRAAAAEDGPAETTGTAEADLPVSDRLTLRLGDALAAELDADAIEAELDTLFAHLHAARGVRFPRPALRAGGPGLGPRDMIVDLDEVPVLRRAIPDEVAICLGGPDVAALIDGVADARLDRIDWPGLPGIWVPTALTSRIQALDLRTVPTETALARATFRIYERNLGAVFTQSVSDAFLADARLQEPEAMARVDDECTAQALHRMLLYLVEDGVPLRPLPLLLSQIQYWLTAIDKPNSVKLAECLRSSMRRQLCQRISGEDGVLGLAMVDPKLEALARQRLGQGKLGAEAENDGLSFSPEVLEGVLAQFRDLARPRQGDVQQVAVIVSADIRRRMRNFLAANDIHLPVLAPHELAREVATVPVELIRAPGEVLAPGAARSAGAERSGLPRRKRARPPRLEAQVGETAA